MSTKTSVIICTYNYGRFLSRCLESVLSQSQPADEIILVDDGSTDETARVVRGFPQVRYMWQENAGKTAAFNRAFRESQGDLICHLDADDYWLPDKLKRIAETLAACDAGGILHDVVYVDGDGEYIHGGEYAAKDGLPVRRLSLHDVLLLFFVYRPSNVNVPNPGIGNTICVRREAVADCFPLPVEMGLAVDAALRLMAARWGLACLAERLSAYRYHGNNSFVGVPGSCEFHSWFLKWASTIPGVTAAGDRKLLQTLALEARAHSATYERKDPMGGACSAAVLVPKLLGLGLVPNWKHFGLPLASLIGSQRVPRMFRRAATRSSAPNETVPRSA